MRRAYQLLIAGAFLFPALARGLQTDAAPFGEASAQAPVHDVRTVTGGHISFEFAAREEGHELRLTDVHLLVLCPIAGKVFDGVSEGPFLVVALPDGRYEVVASHEGRAQRVALTVSRGQPRRVMLYW